MHNYLNTQEELLGGGRDNSTWVGGNYFEEKLFLFTWKKQKALKQSLGDTDWIVFHINNIYWPNLNNAFALPSELHDLEIVRPIFPLTYHGEEKII